MTTGIEAMNKLTEYPERKFLNDQIHARPYLELNPPEQISYLALLVDREERLREQQHLRLLCEHFNISAPGSDETKDFYLDFGAFRLMMEWHEEYTHYKFIRQADFTEPFAEPVLQLLPGDWLAALPGRLLIGIHIAMADAKATKLDLSLQSLPRLFDGNRLVGAKIAGGAGSAYSDYRIHADGFGRFLIVDEGFAPGQAGRSLQRLLEIETYRMLAMLALPGARAILPELPDADRQLVDLTSALAKGGEHSDEELLAELTQLAAVIENKVSATYARFNATRNYASLVNVRLEQLRESKIEGMPGFAEFLLRRLNPAMRTCEAVDRWLHQLTQRIANVNQLLLARIDVRRKQQNQDILESMNRRSKLQLRLQQAIEGLSVAAITYAGVSLSGLVFNGAKVIGIPINTDLAMALLIPVVGYLVYMGVSHVRETIEREELGPND